MHSINEYSEKVIKRTIMFTIASKRILRNNLIEEMQDIH